MTGKSLSILRTVHSKPSIGRIDVDKDTETDIWKRPIGGVTDL